MREIKYETTGDDGQLQYCLTECPFGINPKVGSLSCKLREHFVKVNRDAQIVFCGYPKKRSKK